MISQSHEHITYLAFDYGTRSIGVAVGNSTYKSAQRLTPIDVFRSGPDWQYIDKLVREWLPSQLIVGLPLNSETKHTAMSARAKKFGQALVDRYALEVSWVDETLTTETARQLLRGHPSQRSPGKGVIDGTAAALILESFLESRDD